MDQQQFIDSLAERLLGIFNAYANGNDVPPAQVFRTEGFIEAGCCIGLVSEQTVRELMQSLYRQVFDSEFPAMTGPGIQIPPLMRRAPVYPSTR